MPHNWCNMTIRTLRQPGANARHRLGMVARRGLSGFSLDGSPQNFFESRPLISVVVRANDDQILSHALASLAAQEYDQIEVILVWLVNTHQTSPHSVY